MAQTREEKLMKQRERDRTRREKERAAKIAAGTYTEPSPAQLAHLRRIGFKPDAELPQPEHVPPVNKTPDRTKLVYLAHLERGLRRSAAREAVDVSVSVVNRWRNEDPEFFEAELQAEETAAEKVEDALYQSAVNGNTQAQLYWLKNRAPKRWRDARSVDVEVTHQGQIEAGDRLTQVGELLSRLESRALNAGPDPNIIDV